MAIYIITFIFGLEIGSFLNVVSMRYEPGERLLGLKRIGGRSHCDSCARQLRFYELVPFFSFIFLSGKCRTCKKRLSLQYPIVEILSGLIFTLVPLYFSIHPLAFKLPFISYFLIAIWILIFLLLLVLAIIDFRHLIIPDQINIFLAFLGVALTGLIYNYTYNIGPASSFMGFYAIPFGFYDNILVNHLVGLVAGMAVPAVIIFLSRGKAMGFGDLKLAAALGLIFGWPDIVLILMISFVIGAIYGLVLMARKKRTMKDVVPFGPFLVLAATVVFFFGFRIVDGYFKIFG